MIRGKNHPLFEQPVGGRVAPKGKSRQMTASHDGRQHHPLFEQPVVRSPLEGTRVGLNTCCNLPWSVMEVHCSLLKETRLPNGTCFHQTVFAARVSSVEVM